MDFNDLINKSIEQSKQPPKGTKGRPDTGQTSQHDKARKETDKAFRKIKPLETFNPDLIERVEGEVIEVQDDKTFLELYAAAVQEEKERFFEEYPEKIKRPPHEWYSYMFILIKKHIPKVSLKDNPERVEGVWEVYRELITSIGLFPSRGSFETFTGLYIQDMEQSLNPKYIELAKNIRRECCKNLEDQTTYNPYTQTNKIFLLKSVYGYRENDQQTIEVNHTIKKIDDIPIFGIEDKSENN